MTPKYSIIIPVYNSDKSLKILTGKIDDLFENTIKEAYELIFVDDCSSMAETWLTLKDLAKRPNVMSIRLSRNYGQQSATLCGLTQAKGEFHITLDDDLQHSVEDIPKLIEQQDHDIVVAQFKDKKHTILNKLTSSVADWFISKITGKPRGIRLTSFRLVHHSVSKALIQMNTPFPFLGAMFFTITCDIVNVICDHDHRKEGKSGYTFRKRLMYFSNLIINNSTFLLSSVGLMGILISIFSFLYGAWLVLRYLLYNSPVHGWTSVMVATLVIGGMILFTLGVIGEYLLRLMYSGEKRPPYVIRRKID